MPARLATAGARTPGLSPAATEAVELSYACGVSTPAFYDELRNLRRERLLDAAAELIGEDGWERLTMTRVGERSGIPRQSLYKEVSSKAELGEAVVRRETDRFLTGIDDRIRANHTDLAAGLIAAVRFSLEAGSRNDLLKAVLGAGQGSELLSLLTSRPNAVLAQAIDGVRESARRHLDTLPDEETLETVLDCVVRLTMSNMLQPTVGVKRATTRIATIVNCLLG